MSISVRITTALLAAACIAPSHGAVLEIQLRDEQGKPVRDAVIGALVAGARSSAAPGATTQIVQRKREFQSAITAVQTGTGVLFPNLDTVRHHVFSFSPTKRFELKLYAGTPTTPVVFDRAGVAVLGCNIHDRMAGWVVVMDTPIMAQTDTNGQVVLELPPGEHRLQAWRQAWGEVDRFAELNVQVPAAGVRTSWTLGPRSK